MHQLLAPHSFSLPVRLLEGYESLQYADTWDSGESGALIFAVVFYSLMFITVLALGVYNHFVRYYGVCLLCPHCSQIGQVSCNKEQPSPFVTLAVLALVPFFRALYISMALAGALREHPVGDFVLVELPAALIVSLFSLLTLRWAALHRCALQKNFAIRTRQVR